MNKIQREQLVEKFKRACDFQCDEYRYDVIADVHVFVIHAEADQRIVKKFTSAQIKQRLNAVRF